MKIGDFFVELGQKGGGKLINVLGGINDGMKNIRETSLGTKAAIAASVYALERAISFSTNLGASYAEFAGYTGMSTKMLQKWQYAGRKANVTNQEVEASFINVSKAMGDMLLGKGAPEGLAILADTVGFDIEKAKDTLYVMKKLQDFSANYKGSDVLKNKIIESFGVSSMAMISAMKKNSFTPDSMGNAPSFSQDEIKRLAEMNAKMSEFYNNLKLSMGKLVVEYMPEIVSAMDSTARYVKDVVFGFDKGSAGAKGFLVVVNVIKDVVAKIAEGISMIFGLVGDADDLIKNLGLGGAASNVFESFQEAGRGLLMDSPFSGLLDPPKPSGETNKQVNLNQNIKFGSDKVSPAEIIGDMKDVYEKTYRQMNLREVK